MDVVNILGKRRRMELVDLASMLLSSLTIKTEEDDPDSEGCEENCEECEEDEEECLLCRLRSIIYNNDQSGKASNEDMHSLRRKTRRGWQVFLFRLWPQFTASRGTVEQ
jgi:hypothetical protein